MHWVPSTINCDMRRMAYRNQKELLEDKKGDKQLVDDIIAACRRTGQWRRCPEAVHREDI